MKIMELTNLLKLAPPPPPFQKKHLFWECIYVIYVFAYVFIVYYINFSTFANLEMSCRY